MKDIRKFFNDFIMKNYIKKEKSSFAYQQGYEVELLAISFLKQRGWTLLSHRYKTPYGEIDVIACHENILAFVEVKHRKTLYNAAFCISVRQKHRILNAASYILANNPDWIHHEIRFDVLLHDHHNKWEYLTNVLYLES